MKRFRKTYGGKPLHLICAIAMFAFIGYVLIQIFDGLYPWNVLLWFGGAIVAHDLIGFPLYSALDRVAQRGARIAVDRETRPVAVINHLRIPAIVSGTLFLVWFPLILGLSDHRYQGATGQSEDIYLGRWLLIAGALFAISAIAYAFRLGRARQAARASSPE